jgi:hypothetical protein
LESLKEWCEETIGACEDRFRDEHLATVYCIQLKTRTQLTGEPLQEFAPTIHHH